MIEGAVEKCDLLSCRDADADCLTHVTPIYPIEVIWRDASLTKSERRLTGISRHTWISGWD